MHFPKILYRGENIATIPNLLTTIRGVVSSIVAGIIALSGPSLGTGIATMGGFVSDFLDGKIARKWPSQGTQFGKEYDAQVDAFSFVALVSSLAYATPELYEKSLYLITLLVQITYSLQLKNKWMLLSEAEQDRLGASKFGKTKTAIMMGGLTALSLGSTPITQMNILDPAVAQNIDHTIHTLGIGGMMTGLIGTLGCWYDYNKKANAILGQK